LARVAVLCTLATTLIPCLAAAEPAAPRLWREVWAGADVSDNVWLVYSGATVAPMGHIHGDGLRLRVASGYGGYTYPNSGSGRDFEATTIFGDVLAGWLWRLDPLTLKVFAGASYIDHDITPFDATTVVTGADWGPKGVVELWLNAGERMWTSLDLAYTTAHDTASVRMRSGYRLWPAITLGVEGGLNIDGQGQCKMRLPETGCRLSPEDPETKSLLDYGRTGLFARYEWTGGEVSLGAGVVGQPLTDDNELDLRPYATLGWIMQF
jgi:hypothetical protein